MKLTQLEYILAVEGTGSINLAAEKLFVSQSQISAAIKSLEEEIGGKIFVRSNKGVTITPFGKDFLSYARSVMAQIQEMQNLSKSSAERIQSLSVSTHGGRFMSSLVAEFYEKHAADGISLNLWDCSAPETIDMVSQHLADVGVLRIWNFQSKTVLKQLERKNVDFYPVSIFPATIVVGKKNPLYHHPETSIEISDLKDLMPISPGYWRTAPGFDIYNQLPEIATKPAIFASSRAATFEILAQTSDTYVIAATPLNVYEHFEYYPGTRVFTLKEHKYFAKLGWIKHKSASLTPVAQEFIDLLTKYINS